MSATRIRSLFGLSGEPGGVPSVVIRGEEADPAEVVRAARRFGVPIVEHPELCAALRSLDLDSEVPPTLFRAVALVFAALDRGIS